MLDPGAAVRGTAALLFGLWVLFAAGRVRAAWPLAWLFLLLHTAAVFGLVFGWSHAAAVEHTRRASGVGWGVWVNYLVVLVWGLDAGWLLVSPAAYRGRPGWVGRVVHGLVGFVLFNATVVYGSPPARAAGLVGFGLAAGLWLWRRGRPA